MIVSRTPFRISFFWGRNRLSGWYKVYGGSVLASSINKYCYISVRNLPHFLSINTALFTPKLKIAKKSMIFNIRRSGKL